MVINEVLVKSQQVILILTVIIHVILIQIPELIRRLGPGDAHRETDVIIALAGGIVGAIRVIAAVVEVTLLAYSLLANISAVVRRVSGAEKAGLALEGRGNTEARAAPPTFFTLLELHSASACMVVTVVSEVRT